MRKHHRWNAEQDSQQRPTQTIAPRLHLEMRSLRAVLLNFKHINAPRNAVELDVGLVDLEVLINAQQVESFDRILRNANLRECPIPKNVVGASHEDIVCDDVLNRMSSDTIEPGRGIGRGSTAKLEKSVWSFKRFEED